MFANVTIYGDMAAVPKASRKWKAEAGVAFRIQILLVAARLPTALTRSAGRVVALRNTKNF